MVSPAIPVVGFILIAGNIIFAAVRPYSSPTVMGVQLFIGGMTTLIISVLDLLNPIGISPYERLLLFVGGCINCSAGYYMVLARSRQTG